MAPKNRIIIDTDPGMCFSPLSVERSMWLIIPQQELTMSSPYFLPCLLSQTSWRLP